MFIRTKRSDRNGSSYEYLQIVRSYREGGKVRQQVMASLGRKEALVASGELDGLLRSLARYSEKLRVVEAVRTSGLTAHTARQWGPALVFGRLWEKQGLPQMLAELAQDRKFEFPVERACFAMALQRLCCPGSDLAGSEWVKTIEAPGFEGLALQHFYRTVAFLAGVREDLESKLFTRDLNLFNQTLEIVFIDTTSLYVYRDTETEWRKRGYSRDHRPDLPQWVLGVAVNATGWPIAWEIFPGNIADPEALQKIVDKLRSRFHIGKVTVVADRGMISSQTIEKLQSAQLGMSYILGVRMHKDRTVREHLLPVGAKFHLITGARKHSGDPSPLSVREQWVGGTRYVVCYNEEQARKDAADRKAIVESLKEKLKAGDKSLVGNKGYRRYLKSAGTQHFSVDEAKLAEEQRFDGLWVLRTNTSFAAAEVALKYKQLWMVESIFRSAKSLLETRPIYHKVDDTIRGHVFCSFLALVLRKELETRLETQGQKLEWADIKRDLRALQEVEVQIQGKTLYLRTDLRGVCHAVLKAAGVAAPPTVRE